MYKLKTLAKRGSALAGAVSLLAGIGTSALPAFASADALNPLTERSLALSSSSPGWAFTDGSGNSTYAGPNTGTNGFKTGNTFSFRTTSTASINAFTFQYCTTPAGDCKSPGTDTTQPNGTDDASHSDLNIHVDGTTNNEVASSDYSTLSSDSADASGNFGVVKQVPDAQDTVSPYDYSHQHGTNQANNIAGNFVILYGSQAEGHVKHVSAGWTLATKNEEDGTGGKTGKNNLMTVAIDGTTNTTGLALAPGDYVKIIFFGTDKNYITNPGAGAFFVKINDFASPVDGTTHLPNDVDPETSASIKDGGVTVANVMNQSIAIQTKVLETMDFSVGTVDPDTLSTSDGGAAGSGTQSTYETAEGITAPTGSTPHATHGACDLILHGMTPTAPVNVLSMGNSAAADSLKTDKTFATHSYWRLSSNSSGGATVYYAGNTLSNTEGDKIAAIGPTMANPHVGTEQFGLALDNGTSGNHAVDYNWAASGSGIQYETGADTGLTALDSNFTTYVAGSNGAAHVPQLTPLVPTTNYGSGTGGINQVEDTNTNSEYAFDTTSQTVPSSIATENTSVVNCVTGKMRYIANIAATTPAGIYTTKINYIAAPQY